MKTANSMLKTVRLEVDRETEQVVHRLSESLQESARAEPPWASELRSELESKVSRQHFDRTHQALEERLQTLERRLREEADPTRVLGRLDTLTHQMEAQTGLLEEQKKLLEAQRKLLEEQHARLRRLDRPWYRRIFG
ncbi:MAG TPA: hypothetical protein VGB96_07225 [Archangium sp.]|jgi:ATP phosphoribosyltransferase regulatory subunit HisZ